VLLFALFFNLDFPSAVPGLMLVLALGTLGLAAVGTLFGAITAQLRARELLFPVLLLPAAVPVLLASVSATQSVLLGEPLADAAAWLKLLAVADLVYLVIGVLTFEFVLGGWWPSPCSAGWPCSASWPASSPPSATPRARSCRATSSASCTSTCRPSSPPILPSPSSSSAASATCSLGERAGIV